MPITRRQALTGLALTAAARPTLAAAAAPPDTAGLLPATNVCVLTAQSVEGPFYFDPKLERSDITDGRVGVPLHLLFQIVDAGTCAPLAGARVDVWHADADGFYSGYDQPDNHGDTSVKAARFLRGTQFADRTGLVRFDTIYPGWYRGRTPHIHFKVLLDQTCVLNGQLYLPDALSEFIYQHVPPYNRRKEARDTTNATDGILRMGGGGHGAFCSIKEEADRYLASLVVAADRNSKTIADGPRGFPGGPPPEGMPHGPPPGPPPTTARPRPTGWERSLVPGAPK